MSFGNYERSIESGKPILLTEFTIGGNIWRYAKADQVINHNGDDYEPISIKVGSGIVDSGEIGKNEVRLEVPNSHAIAQIWRVAPPAGTIGAVLKELHYNDEGDEAEYAWMGHVANVSWPNSEKAQISLQSGVVAMETNGLRRLYQRTCSHLFGGPGCFFPLEEVTHTLPGGGYYTVTDGGTQIHSTDFGPLVLDGGFIRYTNSLGFTDWRFIVQHSGSTITLMTPIAFLPEDQADWPDLDVVEACDHTPNRCDELGNILNYGGIPHFMRKNPFNGEPVY